MGGNHGTKCWRDWLIWSWAKPPAGGHHHPWAPALCIAHLRPQPGPFHACFIARSLSALATFQHQSVFCPSKSPGMCCICHLPDSCRDPQMPVRGKQWCGMSCRDAWRKRKKKRACLDLWRQPCFFLCIVSLWTEHTPWQFYTEILHHRFPFNSQGRDAKHWHHVHPDVGISGLRGSTKHLISSFVFKYL